MKRFYLCVLMVAVCACQFDPGVEPNNQPDRDTGSERDTAQDGTANNVNNRNNINNQNDSGVVDDVRAQDVGSDTGGDVNQDTGPDLPTMCNGMPVDALTDPVNCGACDNRCDPRFGQCVNGSCECPGNAEPCGVNNTCTKLELDPNNCGLCGETCGTAEWCIAGDCVCRDGYTLCGGECVDLNSNPNHCGMCNRSCGADACRDGACRNGASCGFAWECPQQNTGPACITTESSEWHCDPGFGNTCGTQCAGDEVCVDPGILEPHQCLGYRPTIECTECPCRECSSSEVCVVSDVVVGEIYCVQEP